VADTFDPETLATWDRAVEVEVETSRGAGARVHRTTIWIVVDGDAAFVRSVRGPGGRWYRELLANPSGAIHAGNSAVPFVARPAADADSIARVSAALERKYRQRSPGPTASMLREETLPTTLRLEPVPSA
jgi:hypothetical protein